MSEVFIALLLLVPAVGLMICLYRRKSLSRIGRLVFGLLLVLAAATAAVGLDPQPLLLLMQKAEAGSAIEFLLAMFYAGLPILTLMITFSIAVVGSSLITDAITQGFNPASDPN